MRLDSEEIDRRARVIYMAMDPALSYADAVRFVVEDAETGGERLQFAGADPASLELHNKILALIEKERLAGRTLTFLEAARRIERERRRKAE